MKGIKIFWKKNNIYNNPTHHISSWFYIQDNTKEKVRLWVLNIGVTGVKFLPVCWYENANFFSGIHQKKINSNNKFCNFYDNFWHQSIQIFGTWIQKTCITNRFISFALPNIDLFLHDSKPARLFTSMTKFCTFPLNWGS